MRYFINKGYFHDIGEVSWVWGLNKEIIYKSGTLTSASKLSGALKTEPSSPDVACLPILSISLFKGASQKPADIKPGIAPKFTIQIDSSVVKRRFKSHSRL